MFINDHFKAQTTDYTVDYKAQTITFTTAPGDGVAIEIIRKEGTVWYDQGTSTAANGLGLQAATGVQVKFLQEHPTSLFLITN